MTIIGSYSVAVQNTAGATQTDLLAPAQPEDMPKNWLCSWIDLWRRSDFGCEAIIKLCYQGAVLGLIKFGLYPYTGDSSDEPEYLEVLNIECLPKTDRLANPVGFWLIWFAADVALKVCKGSQDGTLLRLDAYESRIPYYKHKVMMEQLGWTTIAPGEEGYAFRNTAARSRRILPKTRKSLRFPNPIVLTRYGWKPLTMKYLLAPRSA